MERKFISIDALKKVLSPKEMKNVMGGSGDDGSGKPWPCNSTTKCTVQSNCSSSQLCAKCSEDGIKYCG